MKDYSNRALKYTRGSVWGYKDSGHTHIRGVQTGDRPALIISSDIGNYSNETVVVLFITSRSEKTLSINVPFENDKGEQNLVLCNQVKTISKRDLDKYLWTMPDEVMHNVEKTLALVLGMQRPNVDISVLEKAVNSIIVNFERQTILKQNDTDVTQDQVNKIAASLEELFSDVVIPLGKTATETATKTAPILSAYASAKQAHQETEAQQATQASQAEKEQATQTETKQAHKVEKVSEKVKSADDTVEIPNDDAKKLVESIIGKEDKKVRKPHGFWTTEKKREFVQDKESCTLDEMRVKWGMSSNKSVYQTYHQFKHFLGKEEKESGGDI